MKREAAWGLARRVQSTGGVRQLSSVQRLLLPLLVVGAAACAPESHSGPREALCAGSGCTDECRALEVELCDVRKPACQEAIFRSVRCVRGSGLSTLPRTQFVPQQELGGNTEAPDSGVLADPTPAQTANDVWTAYLDEGLQLLRLITVPLDQAVRQEIEDTGGVAREGGVLLGENNVDYQWRSMRLLAHEYVHTMQEHDYGGLASLYKRYSRSSVTAQGIQAYIEGEAELYSWLAHAFMRRTTTDAWALDDFFTIDEKYLRNRVAAAESPWTTARQWQHYAIGARHLFEAWVRGHNVGVRSVMYNLQPDFGRWVSGFAPRTGPKVAEQPVCNPPANELIAQDALGPSAVFAILVSAFREGGEGAFPATRAWELASQLTEDQLRMFAPTLGVGQSQVDWLEKSARSGMCPLDEADKTPIAEYGDGGSVGSAAFALDGGDAAVGVASSSEAPLMTAHDGGDAACPATPRSESDAGRFQPTEQTTFTELQQRLVPGAPVWVSWSLGFEQTWAAAEFAERLGAAGWSTLSVERHGRQVILRGHRAPATEQERAAVDDWTCR